MKVLVADDSKVSRDIIVTHLKKMGFDEVDIATDGTEVISMIKQLKGGAFYDVITLDVVMPKLDGIATIKEIKRLSPNTKIIMCSAANDTKTVYAAKDFGVHGYLLKPFTGEKLTEVLKESLLR